MNIPPLLSHLQPAGIGLLSMPAVEVEGGGGIWSFNMEVLGKQMA